jgi:hypothetical protein
MAPIQITPEQTPSGNRAQLTQAGPGQARASRVAAEVCWYNRHARICKFEHYFLKSAQMAIATAIPILAMQQNNSITLGPLGSVKVVFLSGLLGALVVFLEGLYASLAPHERWVKYRDAYMSLSTEVMLQEARVGDYARSNSDALLVERAVRVIRTAHKTWDCIEQRTEVQPRTAAPGQPPVPDHYSLAPNAA